MNTRKVSITGAVIAGLFMGLAAFLLGGLHGNEAVNLLEDSLDGLSLLCNTVTLAGATILALLLTLLSVSLGTSAKLKKSHYVQIKRLAKADTVVLISSIIIFQLFNIPITEAENIPTEVYRWIYWGVLGVTSLLSGAMVFIVLLLYTTFINIVTIVGFDGEHHLIVDEDEEEEINE